MNNSLGMSIYSPFRCVRRTGCCTHACDTRLAQPAAPTDVHRCRVRSRVEKGRRPREHLLIRLHAGDEPLQRAVADVVGDVAVVPLVPRARRRRRRRRGAAVHLRSLPEADLAQDEQQRGGQLLGQAPRLYGASPDDGLKLADGSQPTHPLPEARRRVPLREIAQDVLHLQDASQTRHPRVMDMEHAPIAQDVLHQLGARAARVDQAGVAAPRPSAQRAQRPVEAVAVGRPPAPRPRELLRRAPGPPEIWEARL